MTPGVSVDGDEVVVHPKSRLLAWLLVVAMPLAFASYILWQMELELDAETVAVVVGILLVLWLVPGALLLNHMLTTIVLTPELAESRPPLGRRRKIFWIDARELRVLLDQNGSNPGEVILKGRGGRIVLTSGKRNYLRAAAYVLARAREHGVKLAGPVAAFEQGLAAALLRAGLGDPAALLGAGQARDDDG